MTVLKLGGDLVEDAARLASLARALARAGRRGPLVVVHGGGREIGAALARAGLATRQVEGLRVTDAAALDVVVQVLAGAVNTRLVAAINAAGGRAVGLTAADAGVARARRARAATAPDGTRVDLGLVGEPVGRTRPQLIATLCRAGFVPVIAPIAATARGALLNVNADTLAASLAARLGARRLVVAGATPGVRDAGGRPLPAVDGRTLRALIASGVASAGMVAKLRACRRAVADGVPEVVVADGRNARRLAALVAGGARGRGPWTQVTS